MVEKYGEKDGENQEDSVSSYPHKHGGEWEWVAFDLGLILFLHLC